MATTKTITIKTDGTLNAEPVTVVVLFEPKGAYSTFDPIVWQVASWQSSGEQEMDPFTWTSDYAFSSISDPKHCYTSAIKKGQQTSVQKNKDGYSWTDPSAIPGHPSSGPRAYNMTGWKSNIGYGFTTDSGSIQEEMQTVIAFENVGSDKYVDAVFSPTLSVYVFVTKDMPQAYTEGQRLDSKTQPNTQFRSYNKDLRLLDPTEDDLTLNVAYNPIKRKYIITEGDVEEASFMAKNFSAFGMNPTTEVSANASGLLVSPGKKQYSGTVDLRAWTVPVNLITQWLRKKSYDVAITLQPGSLAKRDTFQIRFDLGVPYVGTLYQADKDLIAAFRAYGVTDRVALKQRSGQVLLQEFGKYRMWDNVSPSSDAWYQDGSGERCAVQDEGEAVASFAAKTNGAAVAPSNGVAAAAANGTPDAPKTGTVRRKKMIIM